MVIVLNTSHNSVFLNSMELNEGILFISSFLAMFAFAMINFALELSMLMTWLRYCSGHRMQAVMVNVKTH